MSSPGVCFTKLYIAFFFPNTEKNGLVLAPEKSESVLLAGRKKLQRFKTQIAELTLQTSESVRYLRILLQRNLRVTAQVENIEKRTKAVVGALFKILPNIGPKGSVRRILCTVVHSLLLYEAQVWKEAFRLKVYKDKMMRVQRCMLIRVCGAYRAVCVRYSRE